LSYPKRREECVLFLEQGFGKDCRDKLIASEFKVVYFAEEFPEEARLHQRVPDPRIIKLCDHEKYVLFTMDKNMRHTHVEEIKKTECAIIATESCDKYAPIKWVDALIAAKAEFHRKFKRYPRPWFAHLQITGHLRKIETIVPEMRTRRTRPREV
jgi:hypothetical protein